MPKKNLFAVLGIVMALVVASLALVFTVGPMVSAETRVGYLDKAEYFHFADDEHTIIDGLSEEGDIYASQYDQLRVVIPDGVIKIDGILTRYLKYWQFNSVFAYLLPDGSGLSNDYLGIVTSVILPSSLQEVGDVNRNPDWTFGVQVPENLTEIVVQNPDLIDYPTLAKFKDTGIMRYEAPQEVTNPENPDPEPETPVENDDESQVVIAEPQNNKNNALLAWIGGGIATGLGAIAAVARIVVAKKRK